MNYEILRAAEQKFGQVYKCERQANGYWHLVIKRAEPAVPSLPFMTIKAFVNNNNQPAFVWGNYDLTHEAAMVK